MADAVSEIKSRLNIEDVVAQYVQLKRAGRNFKGLCPFHSEKTPSFVVSPDKQIAYCFGCHKGGDIFKFFEEVEGVDFPNAVRILADRAGVKLEKSTFARHQVNKDEKQKLIDAHEAVTAFYVDKLWNSKEGKKVVNYLHKRGLNDETIREFQLGFAPDSFDETYTMLLKDGFDKQTLINGGLVSHKDVSANKIYDRFRSRLMFPIRDSLGRTVGFGGRAVKKGDDPKYLNSAETLIYHKSDVLFGFDKSKKFIKQQETAVLVEGYMDVLMSFQAGVKNVVAVSGTAFTEGHLKILQRIANKVIFAFDTDDAGIEAAKRAFLLADRLGMQSCIVNLQDNKDPADFVLEDSAAWCEEVVKAGAFMQFFLNRVAKNHDVKSINGKKDFLHEVLPYLSVVSSSVERDFYIRAAAALLYVDPKLMYDELKKYEKSLRTWQSNDDKYENESYENNFSIEEHLLALLLAFPKCFETIEEFLKDYSFNGVLDAIYKEFLSQYNAQRAESEINFSCDKLGEDLVPKATLLLLFGEEKNAYLGERGLVQEAKKLVDTLFKEKYVDKRGDLIRQIKIAETNGDRGALNSLMEKLVNHNSSTT